MIRRRLLLLVPGTYLAITLGAYLASEASLLIADSFQSEGVGYLIGIPFAISEGILRISVPETLRRKLFIEDGFSSDHYRRILIDDLGSNLNSLNMIRSPKAISEYEYLIPAVRKIVEDPKTSVAMQVSAADILHWKDLDDDYTTRLIFRHLALPGPLRIKALQQSGHRRYQTPLMARILFELRDKNTEGSGETGNTLRAFVCQGKGYKNFPRELQERLDGFHFKCHSAGMTEDAPVDVPPHIIRLIGELDDSNPSIRIRAIYALRNNDELAAPAAPKLIAMLRSEPSDYEKLHIVRALNRIRTPEALQAVAGSGVADPLYDPSAMPSDWIKWNQN